MSMAPILVDHLPGKSDKKKGAISIPVFNNILGNHSEESEASFELIYPHPGFSNNQDGHIWFMGIPSPAMFPFLYRLTILGELHLALV